MDRKSKNSWNPSIKCCCTFYVILSCKHDWSTKVSNNFIIMLNLVGNLEFWNYSFWNLYRTLNICHGMIHRLSMMQLHAELLIIKYVSVFRVLIKVNFWKIFRKLQRMSKIGWRDHVLTNFWQNFTSSKDNIV